MIRKSMFAALFVLISSLLTVFFSGVSEDELEYDVYS